jgi:hypothetical protein
MSRVGGRPQELGLGPFRGSDVVGRGVLSRGQLRSRAWRRLLQDVYVDSRAPVDHRLLVRAAALLLPPQAVIIGHSAAHLYGARLAGPDDPVTVAGPVGWRAARGIRACQRSLGPDDVSTVAGLRVTTPVATAYELALDPVLADAVVWLDALSRVCGLSPELLWAAHATRRGHGWRRAEQAIKLSDPRAESPPESLVRLHLALAGLPSPVPQFVVTHSGEFVARLDLAWPDWKFALEYDGQWHADPGQLGRDRRRLRTLNALGWYLYPVTSADLHHLDTLADSVRTLLTQRRREVHLARMAGLDTHLPAISAS